MAVIAALSVGAAACGGSSVSSSSPAKTKTAEVSPSGDIPDSQAFVSFKPASGGYTIQFPEGWARTDLATGAAFSDKLNSIQVESSKSPTAPTDASVRAKELPALQSAAPGFKLGQITFVSRTAGNAVLIAYTATGAPDVVTNKRVTQSVERYEFWKNGTQVTITLRSPVGADNVDPWKTVTNSFAWQL